MTTSGAGALTPEQRATLLRAAAAELECFADLIQREHEVRVRYGETHIWEVPPYWELHKWAAVHGARALRDMAEGE